MASTNQANPFPTSDQPPSYGGSDNGLRSGGQEAINRLKQTAHDTVDRLADKAAPAIERVRSSVSSMSEQMHAKGEEWGAVQEQWVENCRSTVREHPLATVAVALAAGVLLAKILSTPSR